MSGLNAGAELDDKIIEGEDDGSVTKALFAEIEPGEVPDLDSQTEIITAVNASVENLRYFHQDLIKNQGMNKTLAMEAERIMPGFLNDDVHIGYYTDLPTNTRYKATLEAMEEAQMSYLSKIVKSIADLIIGFIEWVRKYAKSFFTQKDIDTAVQVYKQDASKINSDLERVQKTQTAGTDKVTEDVKRLLRNKADSDEVKAYIDDLKQTLMQNDEVYKAIYSAVNKSSELYMIATKSDFVTKLIPKILDRSGTAIQRLMNLDPNSLRRIIEADKGTERHHIDEDVLYHELNIKDVSRELGGKSFQAIAINLTQEMNRRTVLFDPKKQKIQDIFAAFRDTFENINVPEGLKKIGSSIDMLEDKHRTVLQLVNSSAWTSKDRDKVSPKYNAVLRLLFGEIRGLLSVFTTVSRTLSAWLSMAKRMNQFARSFENKVQMRLGKLDKEEADAVRQYFGIDLQSVGATS